MRVTRPSIPPTKCVGPYGSEYPSPYESRNSSHHIAGGLEGAFGIPNGQTATNSRQTERSSQTTSRHEVHPGSSNPPTSPPTDVDHHACSRRRAAALGVRSLGAEKCVGCYQAAPATTSRWIVPNGRGAACSAAPAPLARTEAAPGAGGLVRSAEQAHPGRPLQACVAVF